MKKNHVQLTSEERETLIKRIKKGNVSGRKYKRAMALLELNKGKTYAAVSDLLDVGANTLSTLAKKYKAEGLACLDDKPRSGRPVTIGGNARAKVTALACSQPPEGYGRWSLRLLAEKVVQLEYLDQISHTQVSRILKKRSTTSP